MVKVSIIVPVYSVSEYLRRCLDSCIYQTLNEIEIIVVNDCSPDKNDTEIMNEYESNYPQKIRCIWHDENKGSGGARNTAIKAANGDYILCVDSDDYIDLQMCEKMYEVASESDADMVVCDFYEMKYGIAEYKNYTAIDTEHISEWFPALWIRLVKKRIIIENGLFLPENCFAQDVFSILWHFASKVIKKVSIPFVYYIDRPGSAIHTETIKYFNDILISIKSIACSRYYSKMKKEKKQLCSYIAMKFLINKLNNLINETPDVFSDAMKKTSEIIKLYNIDLTNRIFYKSENSQEIAAALKFFLTIYNDESTNKSYLLYLLNQSSLGKKIQDLYNSFNGRSITLWGAGVRGKKYAMIMNQLGFKFEVTDKNESLFGQEIVPNITVVPWYKLIDQTDIVLVTVRGGFEEVKKNIHANTPSIKVIDIEDYIKAGVSAND